MRMLKLTTAAILVFLFPALAFGGLDSDDLPGTSVWYFHADFREMRNTEGGKGLWGWLENEVFEEVKDEAGIDLSKEADQLTAYSVPETGVVLVLQGDISQDTKDKALVAAASARRFDTHEHRGKAYYYIEGDGEFDSENVNIDGIDNEFYFSFALNNKLLAATSEAQLKELLDNGGKVSGGKSHDGALFVLTAERSLIQAGMDASELGDAERGDNFSSNIMRNTKQVAMMIADVAGQIAIEARLITEEPSMAQSLASVARGLIALGALSDDVEPDAAEVLRSARVDVEDNALKLRITLSPEIIVSALEDN